ncbi:hypothetical protein [Sphingomonas sp. BK235]|uniref:hypothetical protein n=1 Tax=Sphingomonas sp. BK235 TaxID=2512131 RepID=UPI001042D9B5|nr:hypothetical protein [Sphingomonas sp. BK235]TCP36528.1 hypothetical protein EV292_10124 [Sphingomonas sp. BK235]
MIPTDVKCATCAYWRRDLPAVTTGWRRPEGSDRELGTCTFRAPVVLAIAGVPVSLQPETRSNRGCEDWLWERNEGEDLADDNVIHLDDRRPQA